MRTAFEKEFDKVSRKLNITMIIHDTYVKEIARIHRKKEDDQRKKREEEEAKRLADAEFTMQQDIATAEEEKRVQLQAKKQAA